jgi:hypothetical protein
MARTYNVIINTGNSTLGKSGYITYHKVNSISKFKSFADKKFPDWKFATVYDKQTREKIEVIVKDNKSY